ncbi:uncharacterized protein LOC117900809 [Drosophila subobscura]|uniref:uncharacterized protein LOC117900809 n=1 Tax=Drosophila subobscura TaxID=7241 RepID=UPI00155B3762|nr:uncharacterized protein LOC117900809 [Drosophila subobscura]
MSSVLDKLWSQQFREAATSVYTIIAVTVVVGFLIFKRKRFNRDTYDEQDYCDAGHTPLKEPLSGLVLTKKLLAEFNCNNKDGRYLVALRNVVYDVSHESEDFGPTGSYARWSGHELTEIISAEARRNKKNVPESLQEWSAILDDCFFVAGELIETDEQAAGDAFLDVPEEDVADDVAEDAEDDLQARGDSIRWDDSDKTIIPNP